MTVTCSRGHDSGTTDYCDQCGAPIAGDHASRAGHDDEVQDTDQILERTPPTEAERCPRCQTARRGDDRFCEVDGYDFVAGAGAPTVTRWEVVVTADRDYFDSLDVGGIAFPDDYRPRTFTLDRDEMLVGRRSASRGIEPEIDLGGSPADAGISHRHAVLVRCTDGCYAVVDGGSANGTYLDGGADPIRPDVEIRLAHGSVLNLGAWTRITIRAVTG